MEYNFEIKCSSFSVIIFKMHITGTLYIASSIGHPIMPVQKSSG